MKLLIEREVLHQLARRVVGSQEDGLSTSMLHKMKDAAQKIADATAVPENDPVQINTRE